MNVWTVGKLQENDIWRGLKREERKCVEYNSGEVVDVKHFLMRCKA